LYVGLCDRLSVRASLRARLLLLLLLLLGLFPDEV
jgi:hypothetical protein